MPNYEMKRIEHEEKRREHNGVRKRLGLPPVIGTPLKERWSE